jgi:membrane dipeptidase
MRTLIVSTLAAAVLLTAPALAAKARRHPAPSSAAPSLIALDTHLDTPEHFGRPGWDIMKRHSFADDLSQVDYPRMVEGRLDGGFFALYTPQGPLTDTGYQHARDYALVREVHIREMVARHPDKFELAFAADDAARIKKAGKRIVFQSIENSYPMGEDLSLFDTFYKLGVRLAGPVHFLNNQFADSATDKPHWYGLSPLGRDWVKAANRLGVIIDASHASDDVFDQLLQLSKTPIILSHSGVKAVFDHPRNLDDERLKKLAAAGGVIQINSVYLSSAMSQNPASAKIDAMESLSPAEQKKVIADYNAYERAHPSKRASFDIYMQALLHALKVAGVDHVGIGCDWDGGGGVIGMEDIASLPKITAALKKAGYSDADIAKIWGGNVLRVMRAVEAYRDSLAGRTKT